MFLEPEYRCPDSGLVDESYPKSSAKHRSSLFSGLQAAVPLPGESTTDSNEQNLTRQPKRSGGALLSPARHPSPLSLSPRSRASPVPIRLPGTPIEASSPVVVEFWSVYAPGTVHLMSGFVLPDSDLDVGCCGCLGFLKKPDEDVDFEKVWMLGRGRKMAPLMLLTNRPICREKPVKETKRLTLDRVCPMPCWCFCFLNNFVLLVASGIAIKLHLFEK